MKIRIALAAVLMLALAAAGAAAAAAVTHQGFRLLASSSSSGTVNLHKTNLGKVLATRTGMTLYLFKKDSNGRSACYGKCATFWPPLLASGKPTAGTGVKASMLKTTKRTNGTLQVTYNGHPLYRFKLDKKAGQTAGEGQDFFGGKWYGVNAAGRAVLKAPASGTTTGTTYTTTTRY